MSTSDFPRLFLQKPVQLVASGMLLLALLPWPYGFYQILRLAIFVVSIFLAWRLFQAKLNWWAVIMVMMTILFNPIAPIFLTRGSWALVDLVAANIFIACPAIVFKE